MTADRMSFGGFGGTTLTNVRAGLISATSLDAINGAQMYAFGQSYSRSCGGALDGFASTDLRENADAPTSARGRALDSHVRRRRARRQDRQNANPAARARDGRRRRWRSNANATGTGGVAVGSGSADDGECDGHRAATRRCRPAAARRSARARRSRPRRRIPSHSARARSPIARTPCRSVRQGHERQVTNVAAGTADTDAANVGADQRRRRAHAQRCARVHRRASSADLVAAPLQAVDDLRSQVDKRFDETDDRIDQMGAMNAAMLNMATSAAGVHQTNRVGVGVGLSGGESQRCRSATSARSAKR